MNPFDENFQEFQVVLINLMRTFEQLTIFKPAGVVIEVHIALTPQED